MNSPHVQRLRLAKELKELREQRHLTHEQLAKKIGQSRAQISRLENGHVADQDDVMRILDALGVDDSVWTRVMTVARQAGERGWWESNRKHMGERQARYADLEAGAASIREYHMSFIPALLQTTEFTRFRMDSSPRDSSGYRIDKVVEARETRQRMLRRPGGPTYDVILDELAIRRPAAPPEVMKEQLYHLTATINSHERFTLRILPFAAVIDDYNVPRSAFSVYSFPHEGDPMVVAVDTVTDDLMLTDIDEPDDVARYDELHKQLTKATLPPEDSLGLVIDAAKALRL